jgi:GTP-binding protein
VVGLGYHAFVLAEIPGLIEGAHRGQGLGHHFLRHIERTKVLIHLLDGSADNLPSHLNGINRELMLFHPDLGQKSQLIAVNKIDLPSVRARIRELKGELEGAGAPLCFISAATGEGLAELMATTVALLQRSQPQVLAEESQFKVFRLKAVK